jgi:hypothetical protein
MMKYDAGNNNYVRKLFLQYHVFKNLIYAKFQWYSADTFQY